MRPRITAPSAIASGKFHSCAIDAGSVKCWGYNAGGTVGDGTTTNRTQPVTLTLPASATALALADLQSCALLTNGDVYCWGSNAIGQAGDGTKEHAYYTVRVKGLPAPAAQVKTTPTSTCALLTTGKVYCWGSNAYGQLGSGMFKVPSLVPQEVVLP